MNYNDERILALLIDVYCFVQNEAGSCKPSVWKRFVESVTNSRADIRCTEMDIFFTLLKEKLVTLINTTSGKDTKLKSSFLPHSVEATKIKEYIDAIR